MTVKDDPARQRSLDRHQHVHLVPAPVRLDERPAVIASRRSLQPLDGWNDAVVDLWRFAAQPHPQVSTSWDATGLEPQLLWSVAFAHLDAHAVRVGVGVNRAEEPPATQLAKERLKAVPASPICATESSTSRNMTIESSRSTSATFGSPPGRSAICPECSTPEQHRPHPSMRGDGHWRRRSVTLRGIVVRHGAV